MVGRGTNPKYVKVDLCKELQNRLCIEIRNCLYFGSSIHIFYSPHFQILFAGGEKVYKNGVFTDQNSSIICLYQHFSSSQLKFKQKKLILKMVESHWNVFGFGLSESDETFFFSFLG
jgi:hypothetical protein